MTKKELIATELETIREANDGVLKAPDVVSFAKQNPGSALHSQFTWDVNRAAEKYWLQQARQIIRIHVTVLKNDQPAVRAYVSLSEDRKEGGGYRTIASVMSDPARRASLLHRALKELRSWQARYQELSELATVFEAIEKVSDQEEAA